MMQMNETNCYPQVIPREIIPKVCVGAQGALGWSGMTGWKRESLELEGLFPINNLPIRSLHIPHIPTRIVALMC